MNYENTSLWKRTLGIQGVKNIENLRVSYTKFREHMEGLLKEVGKDFPNLTDHSIDHVDYLWKIASLITGDGYPINPLEGYILGCSFLIHDAVLSYDLPRDCQDAWCYPSVAAKQGYNCCFRPDVAKEVLNLIGVQVCSINRMGDTYRYNCDCILVWNKDKEVYDYYRADSPVCRRLFPEIVINKA